jgi:hypothetical protein
MRFSTDQKRYIVVYILAAAINLSLFASPMRVNPRDEKLSPAVARAVWSGRCWLTSSQLAEVVSRGCQFGMLAAPPVVPSCSPHLRGPSGVELWFYTPPGTPPRGHSHNSPGIESAPGCGPGRASAAPVVPPERAAAGLAPGPRPSRLAATPGPGESGIWQAI